MGLLAGSDGTRVSGLLGCGWHFFTGSKESDLAFAGEGLKENQKWF